MAARVSLKPSLVGSQTLPRAARDNINGQSSSWLSDPNAALSAVNDAFDSIDYLDFSGIVIISSLTSAGTGMAFCADRPIYKDRIYLDPGEVPV